MLKFDKKTQVTNTEIITIEPGIYFFKENIEDTDYFRKYIVRDDGFESVLCIVTDYIKTIRFEKDDDTNWPMERCFGGDKNATKITEAEFELKFNEAIKFINTLPL